MLKIGDDNIKAIFFDLDGTLIDTEPIYNHFWREAIKELGYTMSKEQALTLRSLDNNLARELIKSWYNDDLYDEARRIRKERMDEYLLTHPIPLKEGSIEILLYLKKIHVRAYVVTATKKDIATKMAKEVGIYPYLEDILSTKEVSKGKPYPDVYLYALKCANAAANEVLAVEDSPNGIKSISNAKIRGIFIPDLTPFNAELEPYTFRSEPTLISLKNYLETINLGEF